MSASITGAIKAVVEAAGLGISVYRDAPAAGATLPYAVVYEGVSGDYKRLDFDDVVETVQVDLWQARGKTEKPLLHHALATAIRRGNYPAVGAGFVRATRPTAPTRFPPKIEDETVRSSMDVVVTYTTAPDPLYT